ncbi:MAG: hypothetical protein QF441_12270 [Bacteriovoracaceae bacterium]|jgi:exopolyphosphatase/guanosine-5'-triphosphate,3'-diphosphate pyrophosphatase|nr:hypothetical protein [Halobacteriovoraceae bacterium]MDP7321381.1 hypothetical protein [Bacteriovoracaceae bacterium]
MGQIRASIDIGSNSVLLLIAKVHEGKFEVIENHSQVTGLGRDLDKNKIFIEEAMVETSDVLSEYVSICNQYNIKTNDIIVTATEASRVAKNSKEFFDKIYKKLGVKIITITAEAEAYYSSIGILCDNLITLDEIIIMDIGGASTELIKVDVKAKEVIESFSMPVGSVRLNNWKMEHKHTEKLSRIFSDFSQQIKRMGTRELFCVAGTMTSVGNIYLNHREFVEKEVHGLSFEKKVLDQLLKKYAEFTPEDFLRDYPFLGKRSKTILSGIELANKLLDELYVERVYISTFGLRYGTLMTGGVKDAYIFRG